MAKSDNENIYVWVALKDEFYCAYELYCRNKIDLDDLLEVGFPQEEVAAYIDQDLDEALEARNLATLIENEVFEPLGACVAEDVADALILLSGVQGGRWTTRSAQNYRQVESRDIIFHLTGGKVLLVTFGGVYAIENDEDFFDKLQSTSQNYVNNALQS